MLATTLLVASLALADSLNPVTILVALYLASTERPRRRLAAFTAGVFLVYLLGGLALTFGPGELLRGTLHGVHVPGLDLAALLGGVGAIAFGTVLWLRRRRLAAAQLPARALAPGSALVLGAVVTAIDLPTALPYFAAIAAITGSDAAAPGELGLLVVFNALYVAPLALVLAGHLAFGERLTPRLASWRAGVQRSAVALLALLTVGAGVALTVRGAGALLG